MSILSAFLRYSPISSPALLSTAPMNWFKDVFGFAEPQDYAAARSSFRVEGEGAETVLVSLAPGGERRFHVGHFETPSVTELRQRLSAGA